ncbi:MAG: hypothetical protein WC312_08495, partial [Candidatus Omnitrophota bacterium]
SAKQEKDGSYEVIFSLNASYRKDGTGFGLAENDYLAMINNGGFQAFSRPSGQNRGSTFIIELPLAGEQDLVKIKPVKTKKDSYEEPISVDNLNTLINYTKETQIGI